MDKKIYIYGLTCPLSNNEVMYVGKTNNLKYRLNCHIRGAELTDCNDKKHNWIRKLLSKGLQPSIIILKEVNESNWQSWEKIFIKKYKNINPKLKNICDGGQGVSLNVLLGNNFAGGREVSEETRQSQRDKMTGRVVSDEVKLKMSKTHIDNFSKAGKAYYVLDDNVKSKISKTLKDKKLKGDDSVNGKKVFVLDSDSNIVISFGSVWNLCETFNFSDNSQSFISAGCRGKFDLIKKFGYRFMYSEDYDEFNKSDLSYNEFLFEFLLKKYHKLEYDKAIDLRDNGKIGKFVFRFDRDFKLIYKFNNVSFAAEKLNISKDILCRIIKNKDVFKNSYLSYDSEFILLSQ
jgi:group I intron endonuclease